MSRQLSSESSLDNLKREAKRWLNALRENNAAARARLVRVIPNATSQPTLRDVQHALAKEFDLDSWAQLKEILQSLKDSVAHDNVGDGEDGYTLALMLTPRQALMAVVAEGEVSDAREVLTANPDIVSQLCELRGHTGLRSALHFAVGRDHLDMVNLLLEFGADPNVRDEGDNATPLHFAAEKENIAIMRALLANGADVSAGDTVHELDVIGWATVFGKGRKDVVDLLLAHGAPHTIQSAVATGAVAELEAIVASAPNMLAVRLDSTNKQRTMLHLAVVKQQPDSVRTLMRLGADVNATDATGLTPLDQAALNGQHELAELLLQGGARVALPAAVALGRVNDMQRIVSENPAILQPGNLYGTLIVQASESASGAVIEMLLRGGASVNVRAPTDSSVDHTVGYTALHAAAFHGNAAAVEVLLGHGASVRARETKYCGTPAGWARYAGHSEICQRILQADVDIFDAVDFGLVDRIPQIVARDPGAVTRRFGEYVNCETKDGDRWRDPNRTPLDAAYEKDDAETIRVLRELDSKLSSLRHGERVTRFLRNACPDWRTIGGSSIGMAQSTALRLLEQHPGTARENIFTAVACGDIEHVAALLLEQPSLANEPGGPWAATPLLYLASARLNAHAADNAVAIAKLLLDHGAGPNAYLPGSDEPLYTVFAVTMGMGERIAPLHAHARELVELLLERGAEPYDLQVLYNVFADHASRLRLSDDFVWLLELIHEQSVKLGRASDWDDPQWRMLDIGDYRPGAYYLLSAAASAGLYRLLDWMLSHGASPTLQSQLSRHAGTSIIDEARRRGNAGIVELLTRHGAANVDPAPSGYDAFVEACSRLDRSTAQAMVAEHPQYLTNFRALFHAVMLDRADVVELLLDLGVSPDIPESVHTNSRALHVAALQGSSNTATVLLARGAEVDARELVHGATPMGMASWAQHPHLCEIIGAHSRDLFNLTRAGNVRRVRQVLDREPELVNTVHPHGESLLMWLPDDEDKAVELAKLFLSLGIDARFRDPNGETALQMAESRALTRVVAGLSEAGRGKGV